jgi:phosphoglycerate dehydrogenase-like enzyme
MMGEYVVASIVKHERNLMAVYENQKSSLWNRDGKISNYRTIADLTIGILGAGTIGTHSE